jgi:hypothetical protein
VFVRFQKRSAKRSRSLPALQRRFHHAPLGDAPCQLQGPARPQDRREPRLRGAETVRDAIHDFNERGLDALVANSSRPKRTRDAFDEKSAEALRQILHRSPREFGHQRAACGLLRWLRRSPSSKRRTHRETSLGGNHPGEFVAYSRSEMDAGPKRWITSPNPLCTKEKKKARPTDEYGWRKSRCLGSGL